MMPKRSAKKPPRQEIEVKLVVCAAAPGNVVAAVAALTRVGPYRLAEGGRQEIADAYFDTPDGALARKGLSLRLRRLNHRWLVTLKGPSACQREGLAQRMELELPWGSAGLAAVVSALQAEGIELPAAAPPKPDEAPHAALTRQGVHLIQKRETIRRARGIFEDKSTATAPLAEMAIDEVVYLLAAGTARHSEIEVEACPGAGAATILEVARLLRKQFDPALLPWGYGKLATGKALALMTAAAGWTGLLDAERRLLPAAYERIRGILETGGAAKGPCPS